MAFALSTVASEVSPSEQFDKSVFAMTGDGAGIANPGGTVGFKW